MRCCCLGRSSNCRIWFQLILAYSSFAIGCYYLMLYNIPTSVVTNQLDLQLDLQTWAETSIDLPFLRVTKNNHDEPLKTTMRANIGQHTTTLPHREVDINKPPTQQHHGAILEYLTRKLDIDQKEGTGEAADNNNNKKRLGFFPSSFLSTPLGNSTTYQQRYCNLQGKEWCPSGQDEWQKNAPYLMIIGAKKAGTTSLWTSLVRDHSHIVTATTVDDDDHSSSTKELLFFSQYRFPTKVYMDSTKDGGRVRVQSIRKNYHQKMFPQVKARQRLGVISLDASPQYLLNWPSAVRPILCSSPWIKLLVIVRNPTDRLWSHYNFLRKVKKKRGKVFRHTFDEWVQNDLTMLSELGLANVMNISDGIIPTSTTQIMMSEEDLALAWSKYTRRSSESQVGRGFYALNLYQWFQELRRLGRDPHEALKIVRLEDLKDDASVTSKVISEIYEWLGLPPVMTVSLEGADGKDDDANSTDKKTESIESGLAHKMDTNYDGPGLSDATRELLDTFYAPYNKMLSRLLGDERWQYHRTAANGAGDTVVWPRNDEKNGPLFRLPTEASLSAVPCGGRYTGTSKRYRGSISENIASADNEALSRPRFASLAKIPQSDQSPILSYLRAEWETNSFPNTNHADSNNNLTMSFLYQEQQCDLEGGDWCPPTGTNSSWQLGAPHFMIIGEKKSGTTSFYVFMKNHPNIMPGVDKELMFFNQRKFMKFPQYVDETSGRIKVQTVRKELIKLYPKLEEWMKGNPSDSSTRPKRVSYDATPQYLYNWASAAKQVLCTCPWVKLLVIVRNPTDRLWSHYNYVNAMMMRQRNTTMRMSFEKWIELDMKLLVEFGLIEDRDGKYRSTAIDDTQNTDKQRPALTELEMAEAWANYTMISGEGPVGRGFYALTIYQWFKELRKIGRDPLDSLKIIRLEDVTDNEMVATQIFNEITDWLGLSSSLSSSSENAGGKKTPTVDFAHAQKTNHNILGKPVLLDSTRDMLDQFYAPYNRMLSQLLGDDRWEYSRYPRDDVSSKVQNENGASLDGKDPDDDVVVWPGRRSSHDDLNDVNVSTTAARKLTSNRFFRDTQHDVPSICDGQ